MKSELLTVKDLCRKALSMTNKEAYISNLLILEKQISKSNQIKTRQLMELIKEKCTNLCDEENEIPEFYSNQIFGINIFDLDRYDIYMITYVYIQKLINDIFIGMSLSDNDLFLKTSNLKNIIDAAFTGNRNCRNKFYNKKYTSALFKDFLNGRNNWLDKINTEIDLIISKL